MVNYDGLYNKEFYGDKLTENHFSDKKLHFKIIENGTILPYKPLTVNGIWTWGLGGVVDNKGNYFESSFVRAEGGAAYTPAEKVPYSHATVIYLGMFDNCWGHCITDDLKFIWFLKSNSYKKYFKNCPIVFNPMRWGGGIPNFFKLLKILEVDTEKLIPMTKPIQFSQIILPDESVFFSEENRNVTAEYAETISRVKHFAIKHFVSIPQKKIYFFHGRKSIGEEKIAQYLQSKDFIVIQPEKFSLEDQLNILANCESFVSTAGSTAHNMIFLKDNSKVTIIPRAAYLTACHPALDSLFDLKINYVDSTLSIFANDNKGSFCYIVSENLRKYCGEKVTEKYTDEDFATFIAYVRYAMSRGLKENPQELEYLKNILPEFMEQLKTKKYLLEKFGITIQ